jgi:hypothetical protein
MMPAGYPYTAPEQLPALLGASTGQHGWAAKFRPPSHLPLKNLSVVPAEVLAARVELLIDRQPHPLAIKSLNKSRAELPARARATRTRRSSRTVMAPWSNRRWWRAQSANPFGTSSGPPCACQRMCAPSTPIKPSTKRTENPQTQHSARYASSTAARNAMSRRRVGDRGAKLEADRFENLLV